MKFDIKICGTTNRDDALYALESGADYLGFILYNKSPRSISPLKLAQLMDQTEEVDCAVGVCVNMPPEDIRAVARDCNLRAIQLHGDETPQGYSGFDHETWRAVKLRDGATLPDAALWPDTRLVVDADVPGLYGGTGETADWDAAGVLATQRELMLAGGLTPDNVAQAIRAVKPAGIDVASGVEASPGHKDRARLAAFIERARAAATELAGNQT